MFGGLNDCFYICVPNQGLVINMLTMSILNRP